MRIITGSARGCRLKTPKGMATRPTSDRVKESVFNILGSLVQGRRVLDLFAGTGNLGLEALSRGAEQAVFLDKATASLIRENAERTHLAPRTRVLSKDVFQGLSSLRESGESFDLIFCDPPYRLGLWQRVLRFFDEDAGEDSLFAKNGILVIECGAEEIEASDISSGSGATGESGQDFRELTRLSLVDGRRYGHTTQVLFFQRKDWLEG